MSVLNRFVRFLLPRQDQFFVLLEEIAAKMTASSEVFRELSSATGHEQFENLAFRLKPIETEADLICHRVYEELDKTFVTPIDREDLAALTKALDDVIDGMEHSAAFAALFRFDTLTEPMRELVRITVLASAELVKAVGDLRNFSDPDSIRDPVVALNTLENEADVVYRRALEDLFSNGVEPRDLVRQKDMLFALEKGIDRCEDAMDVIRSVVVKNG
jgi:predicted phosphate transport protein (TIGR00153 family)